MDTAINPLLIWLLVKLNRFPACWTLGLLNQPTSKTFQMENMATTKLFSLLNVTQANTALQLLLLNWLNILEPFQFVNKLPPFIQWHYTFTQTCQIVNNIAKNINRNGTSPENNTDYSNINQEVKHIKSERDHIKHELFLKPLFPVVQFKQWYLVFEIFFNWFEQQARTLF